MSFAFSQEMHDRSDVHKENNEANICPENKAVVPSPTSINNYVNQLILDTCNEKTTEKIKSFNEEAMAVQVTDFEEENVAVQLPNSRNKSTRLNKNGCPITKILKVVYILHFLPRLFVLVVFSGYDTKCALFEKASMVNCSQSFLVPQPKYCCFAWLTTSTLSAAFVIFLVWWKGKRINYSFSRSAKKLTRKASFWRMNFYLSVISIEYVIAWKTVDEQHAALYASFLVRWYATALVIYCLNYVNPARIAQANNKWYTVGYWLTLVMYFCECMSVLLLNLLNSSLILAPVLDQSAGVFQPLILIAFGIKVALGSQCLTFFLEKMFHGDKDLFSEPGDLVEITN